MLCCCLVIMSYKYDFFTDRPDSPYSNIGLEFLKPTLVEEYQITSGHMTSDILNVLDDHSVSVEDQQHFLVICSLDCIQEVFKQVRVGHTHNILVQTYLSSREFLDPIGHARRSKKPDFSPCL